MALETGKGGFIMKIRFCQKTHDDYLRGAQVRICPAIQ